ncbi:MGST1 [Bugula neritina]|uniref:Microsomal glutathione S-transferase 1 n=1 Tax=Bugula neritina TaxID=10212 RepID=A0A7J7KIY5_BUGNE|nr:MGST1 [Bugula neritina]
MQQNDLENIMPFFILAFLYCISADPSYTAALWHFRIFFGARVLHSLCHYFAIQPLRSIFYLMAMCINVSLAFQVLYKVGLTTKYF